jgi:hypothetical protein
MYERRRYTVGTVEATDPYGKPVTYYTVLVDGKQHPGASWYDTADEVIEQDIFPFYAFPGGYTIAYYPHDEHGSLTGDVLCAKCAREEYRENPEAGAAYGEIAEESQHSTGLMCDQCNEWIITPHCVDCADDLGDVQEKGRTVFHDEAGEYLVCSHCLACAVVKDRAHKTGKRSYRVTGEWYTGSYSSPQE